MPSINWENFAKLEYWFQGIAGESAVTPPLEKGSWFFWFFIWLFTAFFVLGIGFKLIPTFAHSQNPLSPKLNFWGNNLLWMGILGAGWLSVRQLSVGFLGARFWLVVGLIWFLVILSFAIRYFVNFYHFELVYFKKSVLKKT